MNSQTNKNYLNAWWVQKLGQNYGVQWKHIAAAQLLNSDHFPLVDLGAGAGVFLKLLEERFHNVRLSGVEISDAAIENKTCSSGIEKGNIEYWQPVNNISCISLIDVIEHIPDPAPLIKKVAAHCDYLLVACPNFNFIKARWDVLLGRVPFQNRVGRGGHVYWCQFGTLMAFFEKSCFSIVATNHLYPKNNNIFLRKVFEMWPSLLAHEFIYLLKKNNDK